jgi:cell division protein FtsL
MDNSDKHLEEERVIDPQPMDPVNTVTQTTDSQVPPGGVVHNHFHIQQTPDTLRSDQAVRTRSSHGWVWMVIAIVAIIIVFIGFYSLTGQTARINGSIQDNTAAIRDQTGVLGSIRDSLSAISQSIREAIIRFFN